VLANVRKWLRRIGIAIGIVIATVVVVRAYDALAKGLGMWLPAAHR